MIWTGIRLKTKNSRVLRLCCVWYHDMDRYQAENKEQSCTKTVLCMCTMIWTGIRLKTKNSHVLRLCCLWYHDMDRYQAENKEQSCIKTVLCMVP